MPEAERPVLLHPNDTLGAIDHLRRGMLELDHGTLLTTHIHKVFVREHTAGWRVWVRTRLGREFQIPGTDQTRPDADLLQQRIVQVTRDRNAALGMNTEDDLD